MSRHQYSAYLSRIERADERTRTAYPCSLRVIIHALRGYAGACRNRISKLATFLCLAVRCTVLRSRWCQSGVRISRLARRESRNLPYRQGRLRLREKFCHRVSGQARAVVRSFRAVNGVAAAQRPRRSLALSRRGFRRSSLLSRCASGPVRWQPPLRSPRALRPRSGRAPCSRPCPLAASCSGGRNRNDAP